MSGWIPFAMSLSCSWSFSLVTSSRSCPSSIVRSIKRHCADSNCADNSLLSCVNWAVSRLSSSALYTNVHDRQRLKVIYRHLHLMTSSSLQFKVAYWPAMTLGGAAQVATAHYPSERTLDPTYAPASRSMAYTPQYSPATTHCNVQVSGIWVPW